jgi:hypothetical protein
MSQSSERRRLLEGTRTLRKAHVTLTLKSTLMSKRSRAFSQCAGGRITQLPLDDGIFNSGTPLSAPAPFTSTLRPPHLFNAFRNRPSALRPVYAPAQPRGLPLCRDSPYPSAQPSDIFASTSCPPTRTPSRPPREPSAAAHGSTQAGRGSIEARVHSR